MTSANVPPHIQRRMLAIRHHKSQIHPEHSRAFSSILEHPQASLSILENRTKWEVHVMLQAISFCSLSGHVTSAKDDPPLLDAIHRVRNCIL